MFKVYVGSTNKVKVQACKEVLKYFEVIGYDSNSKVSKQPRTDEETITGAINRAKDIPYQGIRIGLEAGVQKCMDNLYLVNWGVLIDENNNIYYAGGTRIPLPGFVEEKLNTTDLELAEIMDQYFNTIDIKHNEGAVGVFTDGQVKRVDIFIHIVKLLYGQYLASKKIKK